MAILRGIRSEFIKLHHTSILWLHLLIPLLGAAVFTLYFSLYPTIANEQKMALVLELTATVFPIVISVICGMMATLEEKAAGFQAMLSDRNGRVIPYFNKLATAVLLGVTATTMLISMTLLGLSLISLDQVAYDRFVIAAMGMFIGSIPLYIIQMFLSIKWGLGSSVFVGIIGSLVSIMFSNVETASWVYIPFAWGMKIMQNLIKLNPLSINSFEGKFISELGIITIFSFIFLFVSFVWFQRWEQRKSFE